MKKIKDFIKKQKKDLKNDKVTYYTLKGSLIAILVIIMLLLMAYAYYTVVVTGVGTATKATTSNLAITFTDSANVSVNNMRPIYDSMKATDSYEKTFSIANLSSNNSRVGSEYKIYLNLTSIDNSLKSNYMKWELLLGSDVIYSGNLSSFETGNNLLTTDEVSLPLQSTHNLKFRLWLSYDENVDQMSLLDNSLAGKLKVVANEETSSSLFGDCNSSSAKLNCKILANTPPVSTPTTIPGEELSPALDHFEDLGLSSITNSYTLSTTDQEGYITYGTGYTLDDQTGRYTLTNAVTEKYSTAYTSLPGKYVSRYYTVSYSRHTYRDISYVYQIQTAPYDASANVTLTYKYTSKDEIYADTAELVEGPADDYHAPTYYYRGAVTNNYVSFGEYTTTEAIYYWEDAGYNSSQECIAMHLSEGETQEQAEELCNDVWALYEAGDPIIWRIIRINGDGTIRMVLDSYTSLDPTAWNNNYDTGYGVETELPIALSYINYGNSTIKGAVDSWYNTNIGNNATYSNKVATTKFCNDRSYTYYEDYNYYELGSFGRTTSPSMTCPKTNYIHNLPVGLMTMDEVVFAGIYTYNTNFLYYLYNDLIGGNWWLLSVHYWWWDGTLTAFYLNANNGSLYFDDLNMEAYIRPVISLKSDVIVTGSGTSADPYVVQ